MKQDRLLWYKQTEMLHSNLNEHTHIMFLEHSHSLKKHTHTHDLDVVLHSCIAAKDAAHMCVCVGCESGLVSTVPTDMGTTYDR